MLGLALIYFIGKYYYNLAAYNDKNKWGYALFGVAAYYAGAFVFGLIAGVVITLDGTTSVDDVNEVVLALIGLPFGVGATALLYHLLKKNWEKHKKVSLEMIEQIGSESDL